MRRSRFTLTYPNGTRRVVLAYSAEWLQGVYPDANIERGDYRRREAARAAKAAGGGFRLDNAAIAAAIDVLGIQWPVRFATNGRYGGSLGNHTLIYSGGQCRHEGGRIKRIDTATDVHHRVMVKSYTDAASAGRILWHELCHAMQAERAAHEAGATTFKEIHAVWATAYNDGAGYSRKPTEVEAKGFEAWNDDHPLAKELS